MGTYCAIILYALFGYVHFCICMHHWQHCGDNEVGWQPYSKRAIESVNKEDYASDVRVSIALSIVWVLSFAPVLLIAGMSSSLGVRYINYSKNKVA